MQIARHNGYKPSCNMINMVPKQNTVGGKSPHELFTGIKLDYLRNAKVRRICTSSYERQCTKQIRYKSGLWGQYLWGIPASNLKVSYIFLSLTWKTIKCRSWTHLPMPLKIINMITNRSARDGNNLDVNTEMRIGGFKSNEVIKDQDYNLEVRRIDSGSMIHDDQERLEGAHE